MKRVLLKTFGLGDVDDVEIYAGAAIWEWMQKPEFKMISAFEITADQMYWTQGLSRGYDGFTVYVWVDVSEETEILLKLSGLCQQT